MLAHILDTIVIRSKAVVYLSHSDASFQNHVGTGAPNRVINLYHALKGIMLIRRESRYALEYTVHQGSPWWLWDGSIVDKGHRHLQYLALRLRQDAGAFHEPEETKSESYSK